MEEETSILEKIIAGLESSLPAIFTRREIPRLTGGALSVGYLANLGADGPPYIRDRRHAVYEKSSFIGWYKARLSGK
jgi:hypothetical protein